MSNELLKVSLVQRILNIENKKLLKKINELLEEESMIDEKLKTLYEKQIWFKVGLKMATGGLIEFFEIKEIIDNTGKLQRIKGGINFTKTAEKNFPQLKTPSGGNSARPYIYDTLKRNNTNKDIYSSVDKLNKLKEYCKSHGIGVSTEFYNLLHKKLH